MARRAGTTLLAGGRGVGGRGGTVQLLESSSAQRGEYRGEFSGEELHLENEGRDYPRIVIRRDDRASVSRDDDGRCAEIG